MASNRETVRDAFVTLLRASLTGAGNPAEYVYGYRVGDFLGWSPVVVVSSAGSARQRMTVQGGWHKVYLQVDTFVLYSDGDDWTEGMAEDRLDLLESSIAAVIDANQVTAQWKAINYTGVNQRSARIDVEIGGVEYARESMLLEFETYG